jgi:hypothetical protein
VTANFLTPASIELADAIEYYEDQRPGLGYEFLSEVEAAINKIIQFPDAWTPLSKRTRRILLKRFPFGLLYHIQEDKAVVAAVMDLRRNPTNWEDLLK